MMGRAYFNRLVEIVPVPEFAYEMNGLAIEKTSACNPFHLSFSRTYQIYGELVSMSSLRFA